MSNDTFTPEMAAGPDGLFCVRCGCVVTWE